MDYHLGFLGSGRRDRIPDNSKRLIMSRDEILRLAIESNLAYKSNGHWWMDAGEVGHETWVFADAIEKATIERCAALCEQLGAEGYGTLYIAATMRGLNG